MPEKNGWTITVEKGGGILTNGDLRIVFGKKKYAMGNTMEWARIDLTKMAHGDYTRDTSENTVPRFIAAADRMSSLFKAGGKTVTVNCMNGNSRTSFALIVYLIRHQEFSWDDASKLIAGGQAERKDIRFNLNAEGHNGRYSEWVKAWIKKGSMKRGGDVDYMGGHSGVTQERNKTVFMVYDKWPGVRKRKHEEQIAHDEESDELYRPTRKRKTHTPEAERLRAEATRFLRANPYAGSYTRSGRSFKGDGI